MVFWCFNYSRGSQPGGRKRSQSSVHLGTFVPVGGEANDVKGGADTKRLGTPEL